MRSWHEEQEAKAARWIVPAIIVLLFLGPIVLSFVLYAMYGGEAP